MERIKLNLIPSGVPPIVHLSQYDDGRKFAIDLFEGDSVYVLDGTETLTVDSRKPDGHIVTLTVTNTGTSSVVIDTVEQLTAVHGESYAKLKIEKGSVTIATLEFLIAVSRDPSENGDPSDSFIQNLETQVNGFVATAVADQYDSANVIFDNTPTAGHGNGYAVTSEFFAIENVTSQITWNETVVTTGTGAYKVGNMVFITYMGEIKTHSANDTLFSIPLGLRPPKNWRVPFTVNASTYGNLGILTGGNCNINQISDNTESGRIYFSVAYPLS